MTTRITRKKRHAFSVGKDRTGKTGVFRCKMCRHSYARCKSEVIGCEVEKPSKQPLYDPFPDGALKVGEYDHVAFEFAGELYWGELRRVR